MKAETQALCPGCDKVLDIAPVEGGATSVFPEHSSRQTRGRRPKDDPSCTATGWLIEDHEWVGETFGWTA